MFSDRIVSHKPHQHTVAMLVHDEPGVLARILNLFMKRNFNIDTITVGHSTIENVSRITITFFGDDSVYEQLVKQLNKLIDVIKTTDLPDSISVIRDLALIKVKTKTEKEQNKLMNYCSAYRARIVNVGHDEMMVEVVGKPSKIDSFLRLVKPIGVVEIARTGITAMARSNNNFEKK